MASHLQWLHNLIINKTSLGLLFQDILSLAQSTKSLQSIYILTVLSYMHIPVISLIRFQLIIWHPHLMKDINNQYPLMIYWYQEMIYKLGREYLANCHDCMGQGASTWVHSKNIAALMLLTPTNQQFSITSRSFDLLKEKLDTVCLYRVYW